MTELIKGDQEKGEEDFLITVEEKVSKGWLQLGGARVTITGEREGKRGRRESMRSWNPEGQVQNGFRDKEESQ